MKFKLLILPVSLLIAFLVFLYFIQPEWISYSESKKILASKKNDLEDIKNNQNKFLQALDSYNSIDNDDKILIERTIPEKILEEDFLYNLNLILNETGAILIDAKFDQKELRRTISDSDESLDIKKTDVSLNIAGNYFQLRALTYSIENLDRLVRINEISLKENQNDSNLRADFKLSLFNRDTFPSLELNLKDRYLNSILKNGLDLEFISDYKKYRGEVSSFDFIGENISGKENLFGSVDSIEPVLNLQNETTQEENQEDLSENVE